MTSGFTFDPVLSGVTTFSICLACSLAISFANFASFSICLFFASDFLIRIDCKSLSIFLRVFLRMALSLFTSISINFRSCLRELANASASNNSFRSTSVRGVSCARTIIFCQAFFFKILPLPLRSPRTMAQWSDFLTPSTSPVSSTPRLTICPRTNSIAASVNSKSSSSSFLRITSSAS